MCVTTQYRRLGKTNRKTIGQYSQYFEITHKKNDKPSIRKVWDFTIPHAFRAATSRQQTRCCLLCTGTEKSGVGIRNLYDSQRNINAILSGGDLSTSQYSAT